MKIIKRSLEQTIENWLFRKKVLIIFGARQVGKTTMIKEIAKQYDDKALYLNCDSFSVQQSLQIPDPISLKSLTGNSTLVFLDEAQRIENIGLVLKIFHDSYPEIQLIATGSSSFDLSNKINEPLTGRALEFILYPFSVVELKQVFHFADLKSRLSFFMRFGMYPEMVDKPEHEVKLLLDNLSGKYLYKDIFEYEQIKKPQLLVRLLQMLALQVGSEVSVHELSVSLQVNRLTIERYIDILEKAFVIFRLHAFSRNLRKEITKKFKVYFYDTGIRNSLISNFNPLESRTDPGALWENFFIVERLKYNQRTGRNPNKYFWRTHTGQEIDYIEESGGKLLAFECKLKPKAKFKIPGSFIEAYPDSVFHIVTPENFLSYLVNDA